MATVSKSLNIQTEGVYTLELNVIPDGATVTPVNDIQTWLKCAGIWDKSYTTLEEVLADTTTLLALISDHNAVDYMVRSKTWASSSNVGLVPIMTSDTAPSGECSASSVWDYTNYAPYKAFDGNSETCWHPAGSQGDGWLRYKFTSAITVRKAYIYTQDISRVSGYKIQGSNNGLSWTDLTERLTMTTKDNMVNFTKNVNSYLYYRIYLYAATTASNPVLHTVQFYEFSDDRFIDGNQTAMSYIGLNDYCADTLLNDTDWREAICNSTYFESVLNVKVPTMTSDTTPSGTASASSRNGQAGRLAYCAFDGDDTTQWQASSGADGWVQYSFTQDVAVRAVKIIDSDGNKIGNFEILGALNGSSVFTQLFSGTHSTENEKKYSFLNSQFYRTYRLHVLTMASSNRPAAVSTLQFYGRA